MVTVFDIPYRGLLYGKHHADEVTACHLHQQRVDTLGEGEEVELRL